MRTTVTIDDTLYREARTVAAARDCTVGSVIEDALRHHLRLLHEARDAHDQNLPELPTSPGKPRPGISIDDNAAVRDVLDEGHTLAGRRRQRSAQRNL
ncbi:MAG: hypothetical protein WCG77_01780 [Actinomycetes bacterium]|jgi:hypothetical protein